MKLRLITVGLFVITIFGVITINRQCTKNFNSSIENITEEDAVNSSPSIQMYFYIKRYAERYGIPEAYAFSLAYQETRYGGPMDLNYNHKQTSSAGALGPMQIMPATARLIRGNTVSKNKLMNDIKLNVEISMKLLRRLHNKYNDWGLVFGAYNTGKPCVNQYAKNILNKQYVWEM